MSGYILHHSPAKSPLKYWPVCGAAKQKGRSVRIAAKTLILVVRYLGYKLNVGSEDGQNCWVLDGIEQHHRWRDLPLRERRRSRSRNTSFTNQCCASQGQCSSFCSFSCEGAYTCGAMQGTKLEVVLANVAVNGTETAFPCLFGKFDFGSNRKLFPDGDA